MFKEFEMRRNRWIAIAGVAAVIALTLAAHLARERSTDVAPTKTAQPAQANRVQPDSQADATRSAAQAPSSPSLPEIPADRPFAQIRPELERRAAAGDGASAQRLGMVLANCNHYAPISAKDLENQIVEMAARGFSLSDNGHTLTPEETLAKLKLGLAQKAIDCKGVSGLNEPDAMKHAFAWIERGAALGNADAEAMFGALAFTSVDARDALADAERLRELKQQAVDYLQRSLDQGDPMALLQASNYYEAGLLYPADAERAYAYLYAFSLTPRASDIVPELLHQKLVADAALLDEAALQRARQEGLRLAACCGPIKEAQ